MFAVELLVGAAATLALGVLLGGMLLVTSHWFLDEDLDPASSFPVGALVAVGTAAWFVVAGLFLRWFGRELLSWL